MFFKIFFLRFIASEMGRSVWNVWFKTFCILIRFQTLVCDWSLRLWSQRQIKWPTDNTLALNGSAVCESYCTSNAQRATADVKVNLHRPTSAYVFAVDDLVARCGCKQCRYSSYRSVLIMIKLQAFKLVWSIYFDTKRNFNKCLVWIFRFMFFVGLQALHAVANETTAAHTAVSSGGRYKSGFSLAIFFSNASNTWHRS